MPPKKNILTLLKDREYGDKSATRKIRQILNTEQFNIDFPQPFQNVAPPIQNVGPPVFVGPPQEVIEIPQQPPNTPNSSPEISPPPPNTSPLQFAGRNVRGRKTFDGRGGRGGRG